MCPACILHIITEIGYCGVSGLFTPVLEGSMKAEACGRFIFPEHFGPIRVCRM